MHSFRFCLLYLVGLAIIPGFAITHGAEWPSNLECLQDEAGHQVSMLQTHLQFQKKPPHADPDESPADPRYKSLVRHKLIVANGIIVLVGFLYLVCFLLSEAVMSNDAAAKAAEHLMSNDASAKAAEHTNPGVFLHKLRDESIEDESRGCAKPLHAASFQPTKEELLIDLLPTTEDEFLKPLDHRLPLTFKQLRDFVASGRVDLSRYAINGSNRVALLLGNGPEAAVALFAFTAAQCAIAPINPNLSDEEIAFEVSDLPADAIVALPEYAHRVRHIPIITLTPDASLTGLFHLQGHQKKVSPSRRQRSDIALLLHTSGTTKEPKLVPLSHENMVLGALCIADTLSLTAGDSCLNMMPLFHIGGLQSNILCTAVSHASVICAPSFKSDESLKWLDMQKPSWYYAGPTIHALMLQQKEAMIDHSPTSLRFLRSGSAALLPSIAVRMRRVFQCTVLPTYSMTECMPVCSHRLHAKVLLDSVGPTAAPELHVSNAGEVLIRGPCVSSGDEIRDHQDENPNMSAFKDGWFHTGDQGTLDSNGYVFLSGRSKEIINRGGEKISPFEIEDSIQDPRVSECAAFAVPHCELGEVVGLAVITDVPDNELEVLFSSLRDNFPLTEKWKPQTLVKVDALVKGHTGKIKRIKLSEHMGLPAQSLGDDLLLYTYSKGKLHNVGFVNGSAKERLDSLGFAVQSENSAMEAAAEIGKSIYFVCQFSVVSFHFVLCEIFLSATLSNVDILGLLSLGFDWASPTKWSLSAMMMTSALINPTINNVASRVATMSFLVILTQEPYLPAAYHALHARVSGISYDRLHAACSQNYMVVFFVIAQVTLVIVERLPFKKNVKSCVLLVINFWLQVKLRSVDVWCMVFCWWITSYCLARHHGVDIVGRIQAHPIAKTQKLRQCVVLLTALLFVALVLLQNSTLLTGDLHDLKGDCDSLSATGHATLESCGILSLTLLSRGIKFTFAEGLLDAAAGLVQLVLLGIAVSSAKEWLSICGRYGLGIYLSHMLWMVKDTLQPHSPDLAAAKVIKSFQIVIRGVTLLPNLSFAISFWQAYCIPPAVVLAVYVLIAMIMLGIPFYEGYLFASRLISKFLTTCHRSILQLCR